ncbi:unnamed protein product [Dicrocoelium dendriticum]|nr:unnamed protein product [Dicrocoelium dendriticum]
MAHHARHLPLRYAVQPPLPPSLPTRLQKPAPPSVRGRCTPPAHAPPNPSTPCPPHDPFQSLDLARTRPAPRAPRQAHMPQQAQPPPRHQLPPHSAAYCDTAPPATAPPTVTHSSPSPP